MSDFNLRKMSLTVICGGFLFLNSCSEFSIKRDVAADLRLQTYAGSGLYPKSLTNQNVFDYESNAKVVFNLPPYTNPGGIGILPEMLKTIDEASSSIRMSVFQFNHKDVFEALKRAVNRGVKVYITTDLCYSNKAGYVEYFTDLRKFLTGHGQNGDTQIIDDKTESCETMFNHNKYMVVDYEIASKTKAWFGSFNPTNHGSVENVELAVVVQNKSIADILMLDFSQQIEGKFKVYKKGIYQVNGNFVALDENEIKENLKKGVKVDYPKVKLGEAELEFIVSPKVKSLSRIVEEIYKAKKEILFSSYAIADQMLISSLINKSNTTGEKFNLFSVLSLPHPYDNAEVVYHINGDPTVNVPMKDKNDLKIFADEMSKTSSTPANFLTPKGELKGTFHYIYPKGERGGIVDKVHVEGIFNNKIIDEKNTFQRLSQYKIPAYRSSLTGELHNKLFLIDEEEIIFGSHNFSQSAENSNDELTVIIKSPKLATLLKNELYNKTKMFAYRDDVPEENFSNQMTLVMTEIMTDSNFKMPLNKKVIDAGDYIEIYNYGDKPVNLLGVRIDDHYYPDQNGEKLETSTFQGMLGTLVRFNPNKELNKLGSLDYTPAKNILAPKKVALIVGKYFNEAYYKDSFIQNFKKLNGKTPSEEDFPILFSTGEYFSSTLGDATTGLTNKDRISLFGLDARTVLDRFNSPRPTKGPGISIERFIDVDNLLSHFNARSYEFSVKKFTLKNGTEITDEVIIPNFSFSSKDDWKENAELNSTPGIVLKGNRTPASNELFTVSGDIVDVNSNTFIKGKIVINNSKIIDIVSMDDSKYPKPIISDVIIYPGLVDTHNHIKYNTMPVWKTKKLYNNRNEWPNESVYKSGIKELYSSVYMDWANCTSTNEDEQNKCLALNRCLIIKYGEIKGLMGGTTSIQGSSSFDETSSDITFRGITPYTTGSGNKIGKSKARIVEDLLDSCSSDLARNIEREKWYGSDVIRTTAQSITSDAFGKKNIADPAKFKTTPSAKLLEEFKNKMTKTFFIHLAEGKDQISEAEWNELEYLKLNVPEVTVIHGTGLKADEIKRLAEKKLSVAWSPTSNLLLYKQTTDVPTLLKNNVNVALGSDWSLSGTKSLLYELKVAYNVNQKYFGKVISDGELLKMATINGAKASHLEDLIGSLEKNKLADFFIVKGSLKKSNPLQTLLALEESHIDAVFIGGNPVVGKDVILQNILNNRGINGDVTSLKDASCAKDRSIVYPHQDFDQMISILQKKTEDGFNSLNPKFQQELGVEFKALDPLCSEFDKRIKSITEAL